MAQGYYTNGMAHRRSVFDYYFRANPFDGGYTVFAGIQDVLDALKQFRFGPEDTAYLRKLGFRPEFLTFLESFHFQGDIWSVKEGEIVFPNMPLVRVESTLIEGQLIETVLLNILNYESLVATKASRIRQVAGDRLVAEFGLRRAQGLAGIQGSRAAVIGGVDGTSNVFAAKAFQLTPVGTQAHSWIQSFRDELTAFRTYVKLYPENSTLLVDTYKTLESGVPNAIRVAKEMEKEGNRLQGIRLDSGDLAYLSKAARQMLDREGLNYVKIVASNQLDEYLIRSLIEQGAPIDIFGIGTNLITGQPTAALDGVYKLAMIDDSPSLKISDHIAKVNLPGLKQVYRFSDAVGFFYADGIQLNDTVPPEQLFHPVFPEKQCRVAGLAQEVLLSPVMKAGEPLTSFSADAAASYRKTRLSHLPAEHQRFENPHLYKVGLSPQLLDLRRTLLQKNQSGDRSR
jgi:nicotinate phosphoribosyltransferase